MSKPIYRLALAKPTEAWYKLSKEEQDALMARNNASMEDNGVENVIGCDCRWSSEQHMWFVVNKFPSMEALQKHTQDCTDMDWHRYVDAESILGTEWQPT